MYLSHAFDFGLLVAMIPALCVWVYVLLGRIWGIDVTSVVMSAGILLQKDIINRYIGTTRFRVQYGAAGTGVLYHGMMQEDYDELPYDQRSRSYRGQPLYRRIIIQAMTPILAAVSMIGVLYFYAPSHSAGDNAATVATALQQVIRASLSKAGGEVPMLNVMTRSQIVLLIFVYYCLIMIAFYVLQNISAYAENKGLTILQWIYGLALIGTFYFCYYRLPMTVLHALGLDTIAMLRLVARIIVCVYVAGWVNAAFVYLYLKSTTHS